MQTSTAPRFPEWLTRHSAATFWLLGVSASVCFTLAAFLEARIFYLVPMGGIIVLAILFNIRSLYFILLGVLPFSIEMGIGSFSTDVPSEPIVILLAGFTIVYMLLNRASLDLSIYKKPLGWLIALHVCWVLIAVVFSQDLMTSFKFFIAKCWYVLTFFLLTSLLINSQQKFLQWFWCLCIPMVLSVLVILAQHGLYGFTFDSINRSVEPIYRNHVNYGVFITMFLPYLFLARSWYNPGSLLKLFLSISIAIILAGICFSYTRGAWLALLAMPVYYGVIRFRLTKLMMIVTAVGFVLFALYIWNDRTYLKYAPNYETTIYHEELSEHLSSTLDMEDMSTVERFYRWIAAVKMFKEHAVYGVGPGNFVSYYKPYTVSAYETYISENEERSTVHNYFLLLLTEQGIPALVLFILLLLFILLAAEDLYHRAATPRQRMIVLSVSLSLLVFLINNTLSDLVEANKVGSRFWMNLGFLCNQFWEKGFNKTSPSAR
jgi:O-antigen ligase